MGCAGSSLGDGDAFVCLLRQVSCYTLNCPGPHHEDQASLELTDIQLSLSIFICLEYVSVSVCVHVCTYM